MTTSTLAAPTFGCTPLSGAELSWQASSVPSGFSSFFALGTGLLVAAGADCAAAHGVPTGIAPIAAVAAPAALVDVAALPFVAPTYPVAGFSTEATTVAAVAGNQQVAVAPKQAKDPENLVRPTKSMRENASPHGTRAGAPPS